MLRIERSANGQVVFTLSGRMQTEDIEQVQQLLIVETPGQPVDATANHAAKWTITELFPNSAPGDPDRVATTSPC